MNTIKGRSAAFLLSVLLLSPAVFGEGEPVGGFPSWDERVLHEWTNRARSDPQYEMQQCPGGNCPDAACYSPVAPVSWNLNLSRAARFQADFIFRGGAIAHDNNCVLRTDISSAYSDTCNGDPNCACASGGSTAWYNRVAMFGGNARAENLAFYYADSNQAFYGWLHEPASNNQCNSSGGKGHRYNLLTAGPALGNGRSGWVYAQDFGTGTVPTKVVSGVHYPQQGSSIELWANWYDPASPAVTAYAVVDGVPQVMNLQRGSLTNGAWRAQVTGLGTGCHQYYFQFHDGGGTHRYPTTGTFGIGSPGSCPNWSPGGGSNVHGDFGGDGHADILWRHYGHGSNAVWNMNGSSLLGSASLSGTADLNWKLVGSADFDADGDSDLVWRHAGNGGNAVWFLDATTMTGAAALPGVTDLNWKIAAVADFDGDGDGDLLWRNSATFDTAVWIMNGTAFQTAVTIPGVADPSWQIEGAADFNGDQKPDIIWRNYTTGANAVWLMNGTSYTSSVALPGVFDLNWRMQAFADYDGNGSIDIAWRHYGDGGVAFWYFDGTSMIGAAGLPGVFDLNWQIVAP